MARLTFVDFYAEKIGKPAHRFTKEDWKNAALTAARFIDELSPVPKPRGRPRKKTRQGTLAWLLRHGTNAKPIPRPVGRPRGSYGQNRLTIEQVAELVDTVRSSEVRKQWPDEAPKSKIEAVRYVLEVIGHPTGYAQSVERLLRDLRK